MPIPRQRFAMQHLHTYNHSLIQGRWETVIILYHVCHEVLSFCEQRSTFRGAGAVIKRRLSMDNLINTSLGQYQIIEIIGQGGMSTIYKAYQESLDRYVAVKVLQHNDDPQFASRFKREARAIAQLQHPNILPIYDSNEQDGMLYLVMQYIENGTTLGDLLDAPIESGRALRLVGKVLDALSYAHDRGIIHRDIK